MARKKGNPAPRGEKEVAFYYPGPVWHVGDWIKS